MADKVVTVKEIVRALARGVITPRYAVVKLEKLVADAYAMGCQRHLQVVNEENL